MAPMPFDTTTMSLKRNATTANFDAPVAKKQNRGPLRHHRTTWRPTQAERDQAAPLAEESVDFLLERTIALALEAVGFAEADPCAIQAFRAEVEECMRIAFIAYCDGANSGRHVPLSGRHQRIYAEI